MNSECKSFRARLAQALRGPAIAGGSDGAAAHAGARGLAWHRHVIDCAACRELLSEEEALDELLRSLPEPHLPPALAKRVLSRLEHARGGADLDRLLDLPPAEPAPAELAHKVLTRVHAERELDRLLELVPAERAPSGIERRVLAKLELARRTGAGRKPAAARAAPLRLPLRIAAAVAVASLAAWGVWSARRGAPDDRVAELGGPRDPAPVRDERTAQPDEQLLASLELFEAWDLIASTDGVDASLATLDPLDEYLLDFESSARTNDGSPGSPGAPAAETTPPKKNG